MTAKLKIEHWSIDRVLPYAKNARLHSDAQVAAVSKSIAEFGFVNPCLVDADDVLIAGHCRILSAKQLGMGTVPVIRLGHLTETQARALRLADNALPMQATWSAEIIVAELQSLKLAGYDIPLLGFPEAQLRGWGVSLGTDSAQDPEATPERPKKPVVRKGDLWLLGEHRLLCGDATSESDVAILMDGQEIDLVFTDPPYNVAYSGLGQNRLGTIKNDDQTDDKFQAWIGDALHCISEAMKPLACIYVCHPDSASAPKLAFEAAFAANFKKSSTIIWVKQAAGMGWQDYRAQHEPILYGWKEGRGKHFFAADRSRTTVWNISRDQQAAYVHPTQKPVALAEEAIINSSKPGWRVADFFSGSGSTLIACHIGQRVFYGMDVDPAYVQVAIERWQTFTGKQATLDGKTFEQVAEARRKGKGNATRDSRKPVQEKRAGGNGSKRPIRKSVHDGLAAPRGKPAGEPPAMAGDS